MALLLCAAAQACSGAGSRSQPDGRAASSDAGPAGSGTAAEGGSSGSSSASTAKPGGGADGGQGTADRTDSGVTGDADSGATEPAEPGQSLLVGVGSWGLRARSSDGALWTYCGDPSTGDDHSPDLLRAVAYGAGVFIAVGGDANGMVMRSLDGEHWEQDVHPLDACPDETYPSSCKNWMGAVAYLDGTWLAGGGNGATMRSRDGGHTWLGLHHGFPEKHIRALGAGAGRFIAGVDGGDLYVTADDGDSWTAKDIWDGADPSAYLQLSYGHNTFVAYSSAGDACFVSGDRGNSWQPCAAQAQNGTAYLFDGTRWVAAFPGRYATSVDALSWTSHPSPSMPRELAYDGATWFGRSDATFYRAGTPDAFAEVAGTVSDFRSWTLGRVLQKNLPVTSPAACIDQR